jgi:ABC-2 type transport system ATP-binding protein
MSVIISHLTKTYGKQNAVDDISFEVQKGEIVGFLGPNGAGKSTTMKIATGYLPPSQGTIEVCGYDVRKSSMDVRKNIGYLPEHNPLYLDMYVKEYLRFIGQLHHIKGRKLKERMGEMIELCGLQREQSKKIGSLSKGYRQRVGLAQALIHNPPVLILDEPTTGLDPNQIVEIRQVIKDAGKDKTVIFSTHLMQEVQAICDRAIIINLGKIVADSDVESLKKQQNENIILAEFEQVINPDDLQTIEGIIAIEQIKPNTYQIRSEKEKDVRSQIFKLAAEKSWALLSLQQQEASLENVFRELTKNS